MYNDEFWMRKALDLAVLGQYTASPNPCVGCVIVREERVIGQGFHIRAGTGHAEVNALQNARDNGESAEGATVYVTLEPCSHYGRTPPCAKALVDAGVARVVAAMKDPNPLVSGNGFKILQNAGIKVDCGGWRNSARQRDQQVDHMRGSPQGCSDLPCQKLCNTNHVKDSYCR